MRFMFGPTGGLALFIPFSPYSCGATGADRGTAQPTISPVATSFESAAVAGRAIDEVRERLYFSYRKQIPLTSVQMPSLFALPCTGCRWRSHYVRPAYDLRVPPPEPCPEWV